MAVFLTDIISTWSHHYMHLNLSTDKFYSTLEKKLYELEMPKLSIFRVTHKEYGSLSASREYLRICRYDLYMDICAAPYGKTFFISWWLFEADNIFRFFLKFIPFGIGEFLTRKRGRKTFYQVDTENVFLSTIHQCVLLAIDELIDSKQFPLSLDERQYKRASSVI